MNPTQSRDTRYCHYSKGTNGVSTLVPGESIFKEILNASEVILHSSLYAFAEWLEALPVWLDTSGISLYVRLFVVRFREMVGGFACLVGHFWDFVVRSVVRCTLSRNSWRLCLFGWTLRGFSLYVRLFVVRFREMVGGFACFVVHFGDFVVRSPVRCTLSRNGWMLCLFGCTLLGFRCTFGCSLYDIVKWLQDIAVSLDKRRFGCSLYA